MPLPRVLGRIVLDFPIRDVLCDECPPYFGVLAGDLRAVALDFEELGRRVNFYEYVANLPVFKAAYVGYTWGRLDGALRGGKEVYFVYF